MISSTRPNWLGHGELEAGEEVGNRFLCGEAENDAHHAGGSEQAGSQPPNFLEKHQDGGDGEEHDDGVNHLRSPFAY